MHKGSHQGCLQFPQCTTDVTRSCSCMKLACPLHRSWCVTLTDVDWSSLKMLQLTKVFLEASINKQLVSFFSSLHPIWFSKPANTGVIYLCWCILCMAVLLRGKKSSSFPSSPRFPHWFWRCLQVNLCQKCHIDKSLLVQAGIALHWWQKGEFHADQINTDVK